MFLTQKDNEFVKNATELSISEIGIGKLAQQQGQSDEVKEFGKILVSDYQKISDELKKTSEQRGYRNLPTQPSLPARNDYDKLNRLSGAEFDAAFKSQIVKDHQELIRIFQNQINSGKDEELQAWAGRTLPVLVKNLEQAEVIR